MGGISPVRSPDYRTPEPVRDYGNIRGVANNPNVTPAFLREVEQIAQRIGTQPEYLLAVMSFETGGSFDPGVRNAAGSGATGLIQFMPATARGLGTSTEALSRMTAEQQLPFVERYFAGASPGSLSTLEGLYTKVLYGSPVPDPSATLFGPGSRAYGPNSGLDANRDGRITAGEATDKVRAMFSGGVPGPATATPVADPGPTTTPGPAPTTAQPDGETPSTTASFHPIKWGDTLSELAVTLGTSVGALFSANRDTISDPDLIYAGNVLRLPGLRAPTPDTGTTPTVATPGTTSPESPTTAPTVAAPADAPQYQPFTVYSTGDGPTVTVRDATQLQPHHDYTSRSVQGQTLEVRDVVLDGRNGRGQQQQPIPSPIAGTVVSAGPNGSAGNMVTVRADDGQLVRIFHMSTIDVRAGDRVAYGQDLGNQGNTGNSTGPHVHIEARPELIDRWVNDLLDGRFDGRRA